MRPVLITGGRGTLGQCVQRMCVQRDLAHELTTRADLDITDPDAVAAMLDRLEPWLVVNAAGYVHVDGAEDDPERCFRENVIGPEVLARACAGRPTALVVFSSDLVFDGCKAEPYDEDDRPAPLGVYGQSKLESERRVLEANPAALVVRTSAFFGPWDQHNAVTVALRELAAGREVRAACDTIVSPTYVPDLVNATLDLAIDGESGIWHLANDGLVTWAALVTAAAELAGQSTELVVPVPARELAWRAPRPAFSALGSARGVHLPPLDHALRRYTAEAA